LDFPFVPALRSSKVHGDGLVKTIAVGMPHDVGESFVDRASDRPAVRRGESQSFGQAFNRSPHYRKPLWIAVQSQHQHKISTVSGLSLLISTRAGARKGFHLRHERHEIESVSAKAHHFPLAGENFSYAIRLAFFAKS
jgi:hypothetical protein